MAPTVGCTIFMHNVVRRFSPERTKKNKTTTPAVSAIFNNDSPPLDVLNNMMEHHQWTMVVSDGLSRHATARANKNVIIEPGNVSVLITNRDTFRWMPNFVVDAFVEGVHTLRANYDAPSNDNVLNEFSLDNKLWCIDINPKRRTITVRPAR
jgi:hypothetical protein